MKFYIKTKLSNNISKTPEGFLLCRNVMLTHTGSLRYGKGEHPFGDDVGEVVMKREPEELFSPATMASFEMKDITVQHPDEWVAPENYQELTHGQVFNIREGKELIEVEGEMVKPMLGDMLIKSAEAIENVEAGMREVSLGYDAFWELIKDGEGRHSKIIGNHCALVDEGRAGKYCAITDSKKGEQSMFTKEQFEKFKTLFKGKSLDEVMKEKEDEEKKAAKDAEEAEKAAKEKEEADKKAKDAEGEERLTKLEEKVDSVISSVAELVKALKGEASDEESEDEEESEEIVADEEAEDEESEDEDEGSEEELEEKKKDKKTGDSAVLSKAEILAPGIKQSKDIKKVALATAYKTADGKKIIDTLTGGKKLSEISGDAENAIFNAAAEMMKSKRVKDHAAERVMTIDSFPSLKGTGAKSAEDINKQNAEFYNSKK